MTNTNTTEAAGGHDNWDEERLNAAIQDFALVVIMAQNPAHGNMRPELKQARERIHNIAKTFAAATAQPSQAQEEDEVPVEVWHGERKVSIYDHLVLRIWGPDIDDEMSDEPRTLQSVQDAIDWLYATPSQAQAGAAVRMAGVKTLYAGCHECSECGHIGINDSHDTDAACGYSCGWTGVSPVEDKCPGCEREGVMNLACPKCSGRYSILAEAHIEYATPPASPVASNERKGLTTEQIDAIRAQFHPGDRPSRGDVQRIVLLAARTGGDQITHPTDSVQRRDALEEAARIVDAEAENAREESYYPGMVGALEECAAAIRALSQQASGEK